MENLRCEYLKDPEGIDETRPRFSWVVTSPDRGERQSAYRIRVASSPEVLACGGGDLWDSGKVASDATAQIVYQGAPLSSRQRGFWAVQSWNQDDVASPWSAPAKFSIGLLEPTDWSARWIDGMVFGSRSPAVAPVLVSASYERTTTDTGALNVTARVRSWLSGGNRLVKLSTAAFGGDPAPNAAKQLRVVYQRDGVTLTKTFPENALAVFPRDLPGAPTGLVITGARYGELGGATRDVTADLAARAAVGPFSLAVNNTNLGPDPAPGRVKQLNVVYSVNGMTGSITLAENQTLHFPADLPVPVAIVISSAVYEAIDGSGSVDVTAMLAARGQAGAYSLAVNNATLSPGGDPAPGRAKRLRIDYTADGVSSVKFIAESRSFDFPGSLRIPENVPYLRKSFSISKPVRRAMLYATALGVYELHLNGQRVDNHWFAPGWTDFSKRLRYQAYDVTEHLTSGENALGAQVSGTWYSGTIGNGFSQYGGGFSRGLLCQLEITYADGSTERVITDGTWKMQASPTLYSDLMDGEDYDARKEIEGWNRSGFDDSTWPSVVLRGENARIMNSQGAEPIRELIRLPALALTEPKAGKWTFDLGQNMVGVIQLKVNAPAGTRLTIQHAEILGEDGAVYTTSLRGASARDSYVCRGGGVEVWTPKFTYHGFRYVEISGLPAKPSLDAVTGVVLGSDTPQAGELATSDALINQLQANIVWGQRGNYFSVPTDCPQRNERAGWTGDAQTFIRTATYNADVAAFFTKWMVDVNDGQVSGAFPDIAPYNLAGAGSPGWGDAGVICPWTIYEMYGDTRILEKCYPNMVAWIQWCQARTTNSLRTGNRGNDFGDWLSINADTSRELIGTAFYAHSVNLVAKAAAVLGKTEDAARYAAQFETIKAAFNNAYVNPQTGAFVSPTQCAYALALRFELLPTALRPKVAQLLENDVAAKGDHLSTGFLGVAHLLPSLTAEGRVSTAYKLIQQETFPSWLFSVKQGATTIWERWDGWTPTTGFQDPAMNSFNHYSLGACGEWMFNALAGIDLDPTGPGYRKILIRPRLGGTLTSAGATFASMSGMIGSRWRSVNGGLRLDVEIPANTTGTVFVPAPDAASVSESGKPAGESAGVTFLRMQDGCAVFAVASGRYAFTVNAGVLPGNDHVERDSLGRAQASVADLLANDGPEVTFVSADSSSVNGNEVMVIDGVIRYRPVNGFFGKDSFVYTIRNGSGGIETRTVEVEALSGPDLTLRTAAIERLGDGSVAVKFEGIPFRTYRVQHASAPGDNAEWTDLATRRASANGSFQAVDSPPLPNSRFYRAVFP